MDEELKKLIFNYGNACFDCGAWSIVTEDGDPAYSEIYLTQQEAYSVLIAAIEALTK